MQDSFDNKVRTAEGRKKIFDNRVKYILFFLTILTAVVGLWDKCGSNVPIKLTYAFGGVLPNVRNIKLFKFEYRHKSLDDPISVEFRDVPIEWK
jgi:hypothetical protein